MDINALLSTIILVAFVVTVVLAIGSYAAYKLRERRRPVSTMAVEGPVFFERFYPHRRPSPERGGGEPPQHKARSVGDAIADRDRDWSEGAPS